MLKNRFESKSFCMDTGIRMGLVIESYSNKYFPNTSLTITCQPLCLDDNKKDRMPTMDHCNYSLRFTIFLRNPENCRNLGTLLPPVTLDLINFRKNCDFSNFLQFLEKLQFLLDTLLPPVDLINFSKNCDFSHFFAIFGENRRNCRSRSFCWTPFYLL